MNANTYKNSIEKLFNLALNRHKFYFLEMPQYQYSIIKTYLWISAFIISAQLAIIKNFYIANIFKFFAFVSIILSAIAFVIAIYTLKLRKAINSHIEELTEMDKMAWNYANSPEGDTEFMRSIIYGIYEDINHLITTTNSRGEKLRAIAWLLISSFISGIIPVISLYIKK